MAKRFGDSGRHGPDPSRATHIFVQDQPRSATRWRLMRPNPDDIRKAVAKEARELGNTNFVGGSRPLDKWIVASQRYACTV
jgi:hypothetical protein